MKSTAEIAASLRAVGATDAVILAALELVDEATGEMRAEVARLREAEADRRTRRTQQKRSERQMSRDVEENVARLARDTSSGNSATVATTGASPSPPKRYNQTPSSPPPISVEARARDWFAEEFYPDWPNKVGRAAAERAAVALFRRRRGDMAAVIEGRDRYVRDKPVDRPWLNPATFLNQERFDDRPAVPPSARAGPHQNAVARMAAMNLDDPDIFDDQRSHQNHRPAESPESPDQARSGFAGPLSEPAARAARRGALIDH